jgi:hypothetical protein
MKAAVSAAPYTHFDYPYKGNSVPRLQRSLPDSWYSGLTAGPIHFRPFGPDTYKHCGSGSKVPFVITESESSREAPEVNSPERQLGDTSDGKMRPAQGGRISIFIVYGE